MYALKPIPVLPGTASGNGCDALGVNNLGQVVGRCGFPPPMRSRGYVYHRSVATEFVQLGPMGGWSGYVDVGADLGVYGINDAGEAVGTYIAGGQARAFRWDGTLHDITQAGPDWVQGRARSINAAGQIAGAQHVEVPPNQWPFTAVRWTPSGTGFAAIPPPAPLRPMVGYGVNDAGWVVGQDLSPRQPFVWDGSSTTLLPLLTSISNEGGSALGINDLNEIVGWSDDATLQQFRPCLWQGGVVSDLGSIPGSFLGGWALAINNSSRVVGAFAGATWSQTRAFVWQGGVMQNLNDLIAPGSGWTLQCAYDISDNGLIVGVGDPPGPIAGQGFLLVPIPSPFAGDADGDGDVDQDDLDLVLFNFGSSVPPGTNGDVDGDGDVDQDDMDIVLFEFGLP